MERKFYEALTGAVYLAKTLLGGLTEDDQRLRAGGLYPEWRLGKHEKGDIYSAEGQVWECFQSYDNAVYPDIVPAGTAWGTFNRPLHGKTRETARPWVQPTGAHDIYRQGEWMIWTDGQYYRCTAEAGTSFSPAEYAGGWEVAA